MDIAYNKISILFFLFIALNMKLIHMPKSEDDFCTEYRNLYDMDIEEIDYAKVYFQGEDKIIIDSKTEERKIVVRQIKNIFKKNTI